MKGTGLIPYPLRTVNWAAGGNDNLSLQGLPKTLFGQIAHLAAIQFDCTVTPTLSSGNMTRYEQNNIVTGLDFYDGFGLRFQGNFFTLRQKEIIENGGRTLCPEPQTLATTEAGNLRRYLSVGPPNFDGSPSDFLLPCAALENAELRFRFPALTGLTANCTAATVTIRPIAWLALLPKEIRVPPAYMWAQYSAGAADYTIQGRALYAYLAVMESLTAQSAIAAGEFSAFSLDTGVGSVNTMDAATLASAFIQQNGSGEFGQLQGEPRNAQDVILRDVNPGTLTALGATPAQTNMLCWQLRDARITKIPLLTESGMRIRWTGTNTTAGIVCGRIESQSANAAGAIAAKALSALGLRQTYAKIKTISKKPYTGDRPDFMPWAIGV